MTQPTTNLDINTSNSRITNISVMDNTLECSRDVSASMDLAWDNLHAEGITTTVSKT